MTTATDLPTLDQQITRAPAGWYPDPWYPETIGPASWLRYWDGIEWTAKTALTVRDEVQTAVPEETVTVTETAPADAARADAAPKQDVGESTPGWALQPQWFSAHAPTPPRDSIAARLWKHGATLVVGGLLLVAVFAAAGVGHDKTTRAAGGTSPRSPHPALAAPLTVRITAPADGDIVHTRSVLIKGVVSSSHARVTVDGQAAVVRGHRFTMRVPLRLGYNEFDVSARKTGLQAGATTVSITRERSASERAQLATRRDARRLAAPQRQEGIAAEHSAAGTTYSGGSASTSGNTVDMVATDGDMQQPPRRTGAPSAPSTAPAPRSGERAPSAPPAATEPSAPPAAIEPPAPPAGATP